MSALRCWKCGTSLKQVTLPLGHYDLCPECRCELHVCRLCRSYDPAISGQCRKEEADYVDNKETANYCHYFQPSRHAYRPGKSPAEKSKDALATLFGEKAPVKSDAPAKPGDRAHQAHSELEQLFGGKAPEKSELTAEERARQELEKLFGK